LLNSNIFGAIPEMEGLAGKKRTKIIEGRRGLRERRERPK